AGPEHERSSFTSDRTGRDKDPGAAEERANRAHDGTSLVERDGRILSVALQIRADRSVRRARLHGPSADLEAERAASKEPATCRDVDESYLDLLDRQSVELRARNVEPHAR